MTTATPSPWPRYQPPHRHLADEQIRADGAELPAILKHPLVPANDPELVTTDAQLAALLHRLRDEGRFAYDTEFIGEQTFHARFCLIQVATATTATLIDPLADMNILPFWELLAEASVQKIVHAGQQDLEPVMRLTGQPARGIYDTQIAAAFTGRHYPLSLSKLVTEVCGADLGADHKFSRWDRRPLTATQSAYAANDVRYLLLLQHELSKTLDALGHTEKAEAEFTTLVAPEAMRTDPLKMKLRAQGVGKLGRKSQAVCDALRRWRFAQAQENDMPVRAFLDDTSLVDLAKLQPTTAEEVRNCKGVPRPVKERLAEAIVAVTAEALSTPLPPRRVSKRPMSDAARERLDAVWPAVHEHCEGRSVSPSVVLNKRELTELVRAADEGKPVPRNRLTRGWRGEFLRPVLGELLG